MLKNRFIVVAVAALLLSTPAGVAVPADIEVFFSPRGGCTAAAVAELDAATTTIDVMSYQLTSVPLIDALARAQQRGLTVRVVVDRTQEGTRSPELRALPSHRVDVRTDRNERLMHNKVAIIDNTVILTGSFNWTANAETNNAENLIVITDEDIAAAYAANFLAHWSHSQPFTPSRPKDARPKPRPATFPPLQTSPHESE